MVKPTVGQGLFGLHRLVGRRGLLSVKASNQSNDQSTQKQGVHVRIQLDISIQSFQKCGLVVKAAGKKRLRHSLRKSTQVGIEQLLQRGQLKISSSPLALCSLRRC